MKSLLKKICKVIMDTQLQAKVQSFALENFTWEKSAEKHIEIYVGTI